MTSFIKFLLISCALLSLYLPQVSASSEPVDYQTAIRISRLPVPLSVDARGQIKADSRSWHTERDAEGTDLLTAKKTDSRVAVMHTRDGQLEAIVSFRLRSKTKAKIDKPENSTGVFFKHGRLAAITSCEDSGEKDSIGRICVTATKPLCENLRKGEGLDAEVLNEMDAFEMRALASVLTLRGGDHQLDNIIRSGNRLGLKTALQTTKGQLIALAKQVAKELGKSPPELAPVDAAAIERAKADALIARNVIEKSFPRLKQTCTDGQF